MDVIKQLGRLLIENRTKIIIAAVVVAANAVGYALGAGLLDGDSDSISDLIPEDSE